MVWEFIQSTINVISRPMPTWQTKNQFTSEKRNPVDEDPVDEDKAVRASLANHPSCMEGSVNTQLR